MHDKDRALRDDAMDRPRASQPPDRLIMTSRGDHHELSGVYGVYGRTDTDKTLADAVLINDIENCHDFNPGTLSLQQGPGGHREHEAKAR
jgi:hypothetical protein